jgi:hypothetical protein
MRRTASDFLPRSFLRWLLVKAAPAHFPKHAFALHLLFEHAERLLDIVVADEYLQDFLLTFVLGKGVASARQPITQAPSKTM